MGLGCRGAPLPRRDRESVVRERRPRAPRDRRRRSPRSCRGSRRIRRSATSSVRPHSSSRIYSWSVRRRPSRVFLGSGGGDAIDTAAKLARRYWSELGARRSGLFWVSRAAGYHGTHGFGTAIGGIPANREGFGPLARDRSGRRTTRLKRSETQSSVIGPERVAAAFVEPVIGAGGVHPPGGGLSRRCR